jgi:hypothetical protein
MTRIINVEVECCKHCLYGVLQRGTPLKTLCKIMWLDNDKEEIIPVWCPLPEKEIEEVGE